MIVGRILNKFVNVFTGLFGIASVIMMLLLYINTAAGGLVLLDKAPTILQLRNYFTLATVFCAGLEFTLKRNIFLAVIFAVIVAAAFVLMLYTDFAITIPGLMEYITPKL